MSTHGEIECPRCGRISLEFEKNWACEECHWVIRPTPVAVVYGCDVLVEVRNAPFTTERIMKHFKGNEATARRRASAVRNFVRVLAVVPLAEREYLNAYGEGRM